MVIILYGMHLHLVDAGEKRYLLAEKQKYSVGRNQADIALMDDNSISRVHAFIHVSTDSVKIVDPGSKYGVYCNANDITLNKRMDLNEPLAMQVGDIVRFGRFENIWRLEKIDITCCTSTLHAGELPELLKSLNIVNGNLQQVWNEECTHLVMPSVTVTIKGKPLRSRVRIDRTIDRLSFRLPSFAVAGTRCTNCNASLLERVRRVCPRKSPTIAERGRFHTSHQ